MEYLSSHQNKLVKAIEGQDWTAVITILVNEAYLIETKDEDGFTPLMHAVGNNAPDHILENMIQIATVKNLEQERRFGYTILHDLVFYARHASAMRRVLEKTNKNINTKNNAGRTPLHYCLVGDWGRPLSYEYHTDAAVTLITYGASISIKDKNGRTALDLYDSNGCEEYEETTRSEQKEHLKELIEKLSIPSEILSRGPDAIKAFKDALKNGELTLVNSRVMFLGQEGSGKTSCVNAMLGKEFNRDEPSTDGIATTVFRTVGEDWEEHKGVDECELTKQILEHGVIVDIAKNLKETRTEENKSTISSNPGVTSTSAVVELPEAVMPPTSQKINKEKRLFMPTASEIRKKVIDNLANKSSGPSELTSIWDYAGQLDYYITHRFFLTDMTSYGVVFSFLNALDEFEKSRDPKKGFLEMTNLQSILFWIRSIFEHAVLLHGSEIKNMINGMIASPTISLIGTHKDLISGSPAEKQTKIEDIFKEIFKAIEGTPYECHIDRHIYAVDNTNVLDEGIQKLKRNVPGYMKAMARTVPIVWVEFQIRIQESGKTTLRMSLDKITKIAVECGINEENVIHVLNYLNDIGIIMYSPTNEKLKNTVITNIHMLIGILMKIVTVVEPDDVDKVPVMIQYWRQLHGGGILAEPLARYLWRRELKASEDDDDDVFEHFIELMKTFGLLFEKIKKTASKDDPRLFVVPSRMKTKNDILEIKEDDGNTVSIYVTPKNFLPDAVYDILVVRFVSLSQDKGCREDPMLFQNQAKIIFDGKHYLRLCRISIDNKRSLKLEISRMKETDADGAEKPACKPHPDVCKEVLHVLKQHLAEVYPSKKVVGYALNILCIVCLHKKEPHFQELENCLKNENMTCDKTGELITMPTTNLQNLFAAGFDEKSTKEIMNFLALQTLIVGRGTKELRRYFVEKTGLTVQEVKPFLIRERQQGVLKDVDFGDQVAFVFSSTDNFEEFDMNIVMMLILFCCDKTHDNDFWENPPDDDDAELTNLVRIYHYKKTFIDCSYSTRVTDVEFENRWKKLTAMFTSVGVPVEDIDNYRDLRQYKEGTVIGFNQTEVEEIRNFQALFSVIVDLASVRMREYILEVNDLKKKDIGKFLLNEEAIKRFKKVRLFADQKTKMFTPNADIDKFDISILMLIIRNCCSLPGLFWRNPDNYNPEVLTNLVRIHQYRNDVLAHTPNGRMSTKDFEIQWTKVKSMLHGAGVSKSNTDKYNRLRFPTY